MDKRGKTPVTVLLVEDNPADVRLMRETMSEWKTPVKICHAEDGVEAIEFLRHQGKFTLALRPDLIILDLNLPRKDGREILAEIKNDHYLKNIPVIVLTVSESEEDIEKCYNLHANCYINKPFDLDEFIIIIKNIENFWLNIVKLPPHKKKRHEMEN